jgi:hypothetical protein
MMKPNRNEAIRQAVSLIWYNLPQGITTFGNCGRGCGGSGRGSGPCLACAVDDLSKVIGRQKAEDYADMVRRIREAEGDMIEPPR